MCHRHFSLFKIFFVATSLSHSFFSVSFSQDLEEIVFEVTARYDYAMKKNIFAFNQIDNKSFLIRKGTTVLFDLSDESLKDHPLNLSKTSDGIHSGGAPIEASHQDSVIAITVGTDTPDQLFVYCENHPKMGGDMSLDIAGSTTDLFLSDFNSTSEEIYIPRLYIDEVPPRLYSLRLGLLPDRNAFELISASQGHVSEYAPSDRRQATYRSQTNEIEVPVLFALDDFFSATFRIDGSRIELTDLFPLQEDVMSQSSDADQTADGQPSNNWAIKYDSNY